MADQVVNLVLGRIMGERLQQLREIFDSIDVAPALGRVVDIPGDLLKLIEGRQKFRCFAQG
jgi:hypothetical protein